jgi:putative Holliday junction resolvase
MGRILGLDFGTKRVGAAIGDREVKIATLLEVHERGDLARDARHYLALVKDNDVDTIVVGLPVHGGGHESASAAKARAWGSWLQELTGINVLYYDERYTTVEAEESLISAGLKRSQRKGLRDMLAARILLQNYLDDGCPTIVPPPAPMD